MILLCCLLSFDTDSVFVAVNVYLNEATAEAIGHCLTSYIRIAGMQASEEQNKVLFR